MKKVQILLSLYHPNEEFLRKQLRSLAQQIYPEIEVLIHDDCVTQRCNPQIFAECLGDMPYRLLPYKQKNLGYAMAFSYLVEESTADYLAFCDQDDLWDPEKVEKSVACLQKDGTLVMVCDRRLIDAQDNVTCSSVRHTSSKHYDLWNTYDSIGKYNFFLCHTIGMCMTVDGNFARSVLPFSPHTGHDTWVTACACACGQVSYLDEVLCSYRRHGQNVSGTLKGVSSKKEYLQQRVLPQIAYIEDFLKRYPDNKDGAEAMIFAQARKSHDVRTLFRYRKLAPDIAKFDIVLAFLPNFLVKAMIRLIQALGL